MKYFVFTGYTSLHANSTRLFKLRQNLKSWIDKNILGASWINCSLINSTWEAEKQRSKQQNVVQGEMAELKIFVQNKRSNNKSNWIALRAVERREMGITARTWLLKNFWSTLKEIKQLEACLQHFLWEKVSIKLLGFPKRLMFYSTSRILVFEIF